MSFSQTDVPVADINYDEARLAELFDELQTQSFQRGDFVLSSGKTASYYMDGRMTTLSSLGARLIGEILVDAITPLNVDAVGGMTLGADPMVTAVSMMSRFRSSKPIEGFLIRKEAKGHGMQRQVEGHLKPGYRVVLLEDVVTTGQTLVKAVEAVKAVSPDIEIVKIMALVDRHEGAQETLSSLGIPFEALFGIDAFLQGDASSNPRLNPQ